MLKGSDIPRPDSFPVYQTAVVRCSTSLQLHAVAIREARSSVITLRPSEMLDFCGKGDKNIGELRKKVEARIVLRGNNIKLIGEPEEVHRTEQLIRDMLDVHRAQSGKTTTRQWKAALGSASGPKN